MRQYFSFHKWLAIVAILSITATAQSVKMPLPPTEATNSITAIELKKHLSFIASDELGGRYTFSQGNRLAARYLAAHLASYGYQGAGKNGSFLQPVPLGYRKVEEDKTAMTFEAAGAKKVLKYGDDFLSDNPENADIKGELVFVGYGISSPDHKHDDYAGIDAKGKIIVAVTGAPKSINPSLLNEDEVGERSAIKHGAIGAILMPPSEQLAMWGYLKSIAASEQLGIVEKSKKPFPKVYAGINLVKTIAAMLGVEHSLLLDPKSRDVKPAKLQAAVELKMNVTIKDAPPAQNVVATLEGTDAKLKDEYVVISAHLDHLETVEEGKVFNGADDDGSGIVSVLEIAQALAEARPKRSILVVFHTGEELGLFGSEYLADYEPVIPLSKLVTNLNIDMVGRSRRAGDTDARNKELTDKNSIYIIGADKLSTELHKLNEQTNADTVRLRFDYLYNDENHPQRFYYRSDHYNYAKHGIPIIFFFTGVHEDYHQLTDDVEKIDFEKMERIGRMIFALAWRVANLDHRLVVDKRGATGVSAQ
ncbi:MAG: M28 family peptidase [Acidobacteriota bacterium]